MFTGLYPHSNGQYGLLNAGVKFELHQPLRQQTIPTLLKKAGYRTGIVGKLHVGPENSFAFSIAHSRSTREMWRFSASARGNSSAKELSHSC